MRIRTVSHADTTDANRRETRLLPNASNDSAISQMFSGGLVL